jgi:hypothetical protein
MSAFMTWRAKLALGVVVVLLALRIALPTLLVHVVEGQASAALGRAVEVKDVDLFLLAGRVTLEELLVGRPLEPDAASAPIDPESALLHWPRLFVDIGWMGLLVGELRVQRVEAAGAQELLVLQADKSLEPLIVARPEASEPPPEAPQPTEPDEKGEVPAAEEPGDGWPLRLEQVVLTDHAFFLLDAAEPSRPSIEFSLAELTIREVVVAGGRISVGPAGVRGPRLRVRRDLEIAAAPSPESGEAETPPAQGLPAAGPDVTEAALPDFHLTSFAIQDSQIGLLHGEGELEVSLDLSLRNATLARGSRFPVELRLSREDGWLELAGNVGLVPVAFTGTLRWENVPVAGLIAAATPENPLALRAGRIAGDLKIDLEVPDAARPGRASVRGRIAAEQIELRHDDGLMEFECEAFELVADDVDLPFQSGEPAEISLASVRIAKPAVKLVGRPPAEGTPPPTEEPGPAPLEPQIAIGKLELENGTVQLIDETVEPTTTTELSGIRLEGSELRLPARDGRLQADLRGAEGLSLQVTGGWRAGAGTTTLALRNLHLPSYSPYVARSAGFAFQRGTASLDAKVESAGQTHQVSADLSLEKIALEDAEEGGFQRAFGMSAPLAVSLLTNARGNIGLPVRLTLDESGAAIDLPALLIGALRQSLVAVLATPLKGLGLALRAATGDAPGGGGIEVDPLVLEPGSAQLTPDQVEHAGVVAGALAARPDLGLVLIGQVGEEDEPALRAQALLAQVEAGAFPPLDETSRGVRRRLRRGLEMRTRSQSDELAREDAALLEIWLAEVEVSREARDRLARARVEALRSVLVDTHGLGADQVRIAKPREGSPGVAIGLFVTAQ